MRILKNTICSRMACSCCCRARMPSWPQSDLPSTKKQSPAALAWICSIAKWHINPKIASNKKWRGIMKVKTRLTLNLKRTLFLYKATRKNVAKSNRHPKSFKLQLLLEQWQIIFVKQAERERKLQQSWEKSGNQETEMSSAHHLKAVTGEELISNVIPSRQFCLSKMHLHFHFSSSQQHQDDHNSLSIFFVQTSSQHWSI